MIEIPARVDDAFGQLAAIGLASIVEASTSIHVRLSWPSTSRIRIECGEFEPVKFAALVHAHAVRHSERSWVMAIGDLKGAARNPLSPRVGVFTDDDWPRWEQERRDTIDSWGGLDSLSAQFVGALGQPAHWAFDSVERVYKADFGASPWEMKTRNRGEEFIQNRLAKLAATVAARSSSQVESGLTGSTAADEAGKDAPDSRTPTGLRPPGLADNALAWCALWGISALPTRPVTLRRNAGAGRARPLHSNSAATTRTKSGVSFALPLVQRSVTLARLRAVLRSSALVDLLRGTVAQGGTDGSVGSTASAVGWLQRHGVHSVAAFRRHVTDNPNAPEFWLEFDRLIPVRSADTW